MTPLPEDRHRRRPSTFKRKADAEKKPVMRAGPARLPLHDEPVRNAASLSNVLSALQHRPDALGLEIVDPPAIEIGLKLQRARLAAGLSQTELARLSGIKQSAISLIESGKGQDGPTYRVLHALFKPLGLTLALVPAETEEPGTTHAEPAPIAEWDEGPEQAAGKYTRGAAEAEDG